MPAISDRQQEEEKSTPKIPGENEEESERYIVEIVLCEPAEEAQTAPLQRYSWPLADEGEDRGTAALPIAWDALTEMAIDRSRPRPVIFAWEMVPAASESVQYDLLLATDPAFVSPLRIELTAPQAEVWHLHLGTRYYWRVTATQDGHPLAVSPTRTVTIDRTPPRWIRVPGITNVRDLGGWPVQGGGMVRQGMIYRSSEMNQHLRITEEGMRVLLDELGIRTDLDLRGAGTANPALDPARVRWVNVPIQPYQAICDETPLGRAAYRRLFAVLADRAAYPLLFHCWGGADRGGTVALLLGALLGMNREHLIQDYELTSLSVWGPRSQFSAEFTGLLAALRQFGDDTWDIRRQVAGFLAAIGVTHAEIAAIRAHLIIHQGTAGPSSTVTRSSPIAGDYATMREQHEDI